MQYVERGPGGNLTARQLYKALAKLDLPFATENVEVFLDHLASEGDLVRQSSRPARYRAKPLDRVLGQHLRNASERTSSEWVDFDLAVLEYQEDGRQAQWSRLKEAFCALVASLPGWPSDLVQRVQGNAASWLPRVAEVVAPSHLRDEDDPSFARSEIKRLAGENQRLQAQISEAIKSSHQQERELKVVKTQNEDLMGRVKDLEEELDATTRLPELTPGTKERLAAFLDGTGRPDLPAFVGTADLAHLRDMIAGTRAPRDSQLALGLRLEEVYRTPHTFQRLTSHAFSSLRHPFDTLHRARVGNYRIGYGLTRKMPTILEISTRENFYDRFLHRVKSMMG